jgi:hypothetical protein
MDAPLPEEMSAKPTSFRKLRSAGEAAIAPIVTAIIGATTLPKIFLIVIARACLQLRSRQRDVGVYPHGCRVKVFSTDAGSNIAHRITARFAR